jgi:hypothetical protein
MSLPGSTQRCKQEHWQNQLPRLPVSSQIIHRAVCAAERAPIKLRVFFNASTSFALSPKYGRNGLRPLVYPQSELEVHAKDASAFMDGHLATFSLASVVVR